jgi:hypothetical protein
MAPPAPSVQNQGVGSISADQFNTCVQTVLNYAQLRTFTGLSNMVAFAQGAVAVGDGGQGVFYWNTSSTAADNNSTVIVPTGVIQGAWIRLGYVSAISQTYSLQVPITGFSIVFPNLTGTLILNPAGTLAVGAIYTPTAPIDGQSITIATAQAITALTILASAGQTILNTPTTLAAGGASTWQYVASISTWFYV